MNETTLNILIVEDNPKFLKDITELIEDRKKQGIRVEADYATHYKTALQMLLSKQYDGVITDLFFPETEGANEDAYGVEIARTAKAKKIPTVCVTSTYHHGTKTEKYWSELDDVGVCLVDQSPGINDSQDFVANTKEFEGAYALLLAFMRVPSGERGQINCMYTFVKNLGYFRSQGQECVNKKLSDLCEAPRIKDILESYCKGMFIVNESEK